MNLVKIFIKSIYSSKRRLYTTIISGTILIICLNILPVLVEVLFASYRTYGAFFREYYTYKTIIKVVIIISALFFIHTYLNYFLKKFDEISLYLILGVNLQVIYLFAFTISLIIFITSVLMGSIISIILNKTIIIFLKNMLQIQMQHIDLDLLFLFKSYSIFLLVLIVLSFFISIVISKKDLNNLRYINDEVVLEIKHRKLYLIFANFLIITGIVSIILLAYRTIPYYLSISISFISILLGAIILLNLYIFKENNNGKKNSCIEEIIIRSSLKQNRTKNIIIVSIIFLSTFIVTYSTGLFSGLYISEIISNSIRDPYTYDAVILSKNPESFQNIESNISIVKDRVIFESYKSRLGMEEINIISVKSYNEITGEDIKLEEGMAKKITTSRNGDNLYINKIEKYVLKQDSNQNTIEISIPAIDGRYVFNGLIEWREWVVLSYEDYEKLKPQDELLNYAMLIKFSNLESEQLLQEEPTSFNNKEIKIYYKNIIIRMLELSQKIMVFSVLIIAIIVQIYFSHIIYIKFTDDLPNFKKKYGLCNLLGMSLENILERCVKKEVSQVYTIPTIIAFIIVPIYVIFPLLMDIETEKTISKLLMIIIFGLICFGIVIIIFAFIHLITRQIITRMLRSGIKNYLED